MLRLCGCALILAGAFLLRSELLRPARQERRTMLALSDALRVLEQELSMTLLPLPTLMARVRAEKYAQTFFAEATACLWQGKPLPQSWRLAAEKLLLPRETGESFAALGEMLDGEEQNVRKALSAMAGQLSQTAMRCGKAQREQERLTSVACFCSGALLCVLLL